MKKILSITLLLLGFISISNAQQISIDDTVTIKHERYLIKKIDRKGIFYKVQNIENQKKKTVHINKITFDKEENVKLKIGMSSNEVKSALKSSYTESKINGTWGDLTVLHYQLVSKKKIYLILEEDRLVSIMNEK